MMKTPALFDLTKREQRTVIVILIALVAGSFAIHYRNLRTPMPSVRPGSASTASPAESPSPEPDDNGNSPAD